MDKCGLDSSKMDAELPQWRKLANTLIKRLDFESEDKLTDDDRCMPTTLSFLWSAAHQTWHGQGHGCCLQLAVDQRQVHVGCAKCVAMRFIQTMHAP